MIELRASLRFAPDDVRFVGTLARDRGRCWFSFDPAFVQAGLQISPYALPLTADPLVEHRVKRGVPIPGVFDDARPDGWGLKLLHRAFQRTGRAASSVSPLEELAFLGSNTMGALVFEPATGPGGPLDEAVDLAALAAHAQQVYDDEVEVVLPELVRAGGSPGGARPKALVALCDSQPGVRLGEGDVPDGWTSWMVKFPAKHEDTDVGRRELAWMELGRRAGIEVPETRAIELDSVGTCFAVRRFDRTSDGRRVHMLSGAGALDLDFRTAHLDYTALLRLTNAVCSNDQAQVLAMFRRAVFNAAAVNQDDHVKNFAFVLDPASGWRVAPGFDLTYAPGEQGRHTTTFAGADRGISRSDLRAVADHVGIGRHADRIIDEVVEAVATVDEVLDQFECGGTVSRRAREAVHTAIAAI